MEQMTNDISELRTDIRLLVNKVDANHESLRRTITKIEELLEKHNNTLYGLDGKNGNNTRLKVVEKSLDEHILSDRWIFGIVFVFQSAILLKQFWAH